jgi:hypothetical protein
MFIGRSYSMAARQSTSRAPITVNARLEWERGQSLAEIKRISCMHERISWLT